MSNCTINITEEKVVEEFHSGLQFRKINRSFLEGDHRIRIYLVNDSGQRMGAPVVGDFIIRDGKWEFESFAGVNSTYVHRDRYQKIKVK